MLRDYRPTRREWLAAAVPGAPGTGHFRLAQWRNGWWLFTPEGRPLVVIGLCHAQLTPPQLRVPGDRTGARFGGDAGAYSRDTVAWMRGAGFNTFSYGVPPGAEAEMNRLGDLNLLPGFIREPVFPDLYDAAFRRTLLDRIEARLPALAADRRVLGYVLSPPQLFSPVMERPGIWKEGAIARRNFLMATKALPAQAAGKQAYVAYLRNLYGSFASYREKRGEVPGAAGFDDLPAADLSVRDRYEDLHPDDAVFYGQMWGDITRFLAAEVRRRDPHGLVFSHRFIRVMRWPDPWVAAMLRGVGPHVDAFVVELYGDNAYREIIDGIGAIGGKPALIGDGMRVQEFLYADEADDRREAVAYERMLRSLLGSRWFLGGCICQYRQQLPEFPWYAPRAREGRMGIRNADYSERPHLLRSFRRLHPRACELRLQGR